MSDNELVNLDTLESLDQYEVERGPSSRPLRTTVNFDIGYYGYVSEPKEPLKRFFSIIEYGDKEAYALWEALMAENNKEVKFPPNPHLAIVFSLGNILNRTDDDMPNWKPGYRAFFVPMSTSSDQQKEAEDWVPYPYEDYKEALSKAQTILGLNKIGQVLRKDIFCEVQFQQNQWDLWQIARAKAGETTFKRYKNMEEGDVEWLPVFNAIFKDREEALSGLGLQIPEQPELWNIAQYGPWNAYFLQICKVVAEGHSAEELAFSDIIDGEDIQIVTSEYLEMARELVNSGAYKAGEEIPF